MTDRTELRRLLDRATPGPWHAWDRGIGFEVHTEAAHNPIRCDPLNSEFRETFRGPDAQLIAAAVNALPDLLDQLDAAEAALQRVRELHRESHVKVLAPACADYECDHEDDCPPVDYAVCAECYDIGDQAHFSAYEEGGVERVAWPCPTIQALDGGGSDD